MSDILSILSIWCTLHIYRQSGNKYSLGFYHYRIQCYKPGDAVLVEWNGQYRNQMGVGEYWSTVQCDRCKLVHWGTKQLEYRKLHGLGTRCYVLEGQTVWECATTIYLRSKDLSNVPIQHQVGTACLYLNANNIKLYALVFLSKN